MGIFAFNELMFHFLQSNFQWYHMKLYSAKKTEYFVLFIIIFRKWETDMFFYFIFRYLLSKEINTCVQIKAVYFYKKHDGELCPIITPKSIFFEGVVMGHHFWWYNTALPETNFIFWKSITCLSLLPKQISQYLSQWYWF